ncbi:hypothetical protein GCM10028819_40460 [Spirosoma humi]
MNTNRQWVALLTEDEDDFAYWQFGFANWANHIELNWFATGDAFFDRPDLTASPPVVLLLDGLIPNNDEPHWLRRIVAHECCRKMAIVMLADHFTDAERQQYGELGAIDFIIKPVNQSELERAILSVRQYAAGVN